MSRNDRTSSAVKPNACTSSYIASSYLPSGVCI